MAKIIKVASTTNTPHVVNPFRTSRNSTTNPFKYSNFEGNTLQFADVFDGFETSFKGAGTTKLSKLKMIATSVTGSMNKIRTGVTESIVNFVKRVGGDITSAWDYAKNTNVSDFAKTSAKALNDLMHIEFDVPIIDNLSTNIKTGIKSRIGAINTEVTNLGKDISSKWTALISKIHTTPKISSQTPVSELEQLWKDEIALAEAL